MPSLIPRVTFLRNIHLPALLTWRGFSLSSRDLCPRSDFCQVTSRASRVGNLHGPPAPKSAFQDWYTSHSLPQYWSCDWAAWVGTQMWVSDPHSFILPVEVDFLRPFRLPGPIEPVAFYDPDGNADFDCFAFRRGEDYFFYDRDCWTVRQYHGRFESPGAFLSTRNDSFGQAAPLSPRLVELQALWQDLCKSYPASKEQLFALQREQAEERLNPPPNDLYTEIFPSKEPCGLVESSITDRTDSLSTH
ncbi:hypothetical protein K438DRAFT_1967207 [Mycena galopus ATCC 62051]|nr:hypothetical protein K438DRAFT_1967207 [Mycena galopus ATCC 62051]